MDNGAKEDPSAIRERKPAPSTQYEEVIELDESADDAVDGLRGYYGSVYVFLMICMFSLLVLAVVTERTARRAAWTAEDKQVLFVMLTFVFHSPLSALLCFLLSLVVYLLFCLFARKDQAYKMLKYYPTIKTFLESKFLVVCFVMGLKYVIADTFYNDLRFSVHI